MDNTRQKGTRGRPSKAKDTKGKPVNVRTFQGFNVRLNDDTVAKVKAAAFLANVTPAEFLRHLVEQYFQTLPTAQKQAVEHAAALIWTIKLPTET